jgi:uncharacterized protein YecE (DUF72 family)
MKIVIGTSGYDYPEWVGEDLFYPASLAHERGAWLTYYSSQFDAVELNFTYYGETNPKQLEQMIARVDPKRRLHVIEGAFTPRKDFRFFIKAYASFTHSIAGDWRGQAAKYLEDIAPLAESGKLGGVLAQFPSSFPLDETAVPYVAQLAESLQPHPLIAEFRHARWFQPEQVQALRAAGVVVAQIDTPREAGLPSYIDDAGHPGVQAAGEGAPGSQRFQYVRMHGRREGSWWSGDAASRYEYRYATGQLLSLAKRLIESGSERSFLMFNNHRHGNAAKNAQQLQEIIDQLLEKPVEATG